MIEGLQIDVSSTELREMLLGRLEHHKKKIEAYESQEKQLAELEKKLADDAEQVSKVSNAGPLTSVQQALKKHRDQVIYYRFMAEHVVPNETYRLTDADLVRLGVQAERYY